MKRLLITGGSGYLGSHLVNSADGWDAHATYFSRPFAPARGQAHFLDLRDTDAVARLLHTLRPDAILHTACSNGSAEQIAAILPAAQNLARAAQATGARLVHLSTDLVFDGEHAPYADDARPDPVMDYGRAKAHAEAAVAALCPAAVIVRPSLIWGLDPIDRQTRWLVDGLERGERVTLFVDELRSPVWVHDLCAALLELAARPDISGPMNLGGPQALTRWDFGLKLLAALNRRPGPNLVRGTVAGSGLVRARNITMRSTRAADLLTARLRSVDEAIAGLAAPSPALPSQAAAGPHDGSAHQRRPRYCEG